MSDHTKEIDAIKRQIDALAGDDSAAARAKRLQLEEELAAAEEELNEAYYDREIEIAQEALDKELDSYTKNKEEEMNKWDEYLTHEQQVLQDSFNSVTANSQLIHETLNGIASQYGITISSSITEPWNNGAGAIASYSVEFDSAISHYTTQLNTVKQSLVDLQAEADRTALKMASALSATPSYAKATVQSAPTNGNVSGTTTSTTGQYTVKTGDNLWNIARDYLGDATRYDEIAALNNIQNPDLIHPGQKLKLPAHAKGTTGVKSDELAWIDENGLEEIVMHAQGGKLAYLTKGSAVIPHDISENLMELGKVDPKTWMDKNRPNTAPANITTQNNIIDFKFASLINIEHADKDSIPEIQAVVQKQLDAYMKNLNSGIKKYAR